MSLASQAHWLAQLMARIFALNVHFWYQSVCGVRDFSIDISRDELDVTTLPRETRQRLRGSG